MLPKICSVCIIAIGRIFNAVFLLDDQFQTIFYDALDFVYLDIWQVALWFKFK